MFVPLLVLRNAFRHKLRTTLTIVGIVVAITAFGLLRTIVDAWYAGAERELVGAAGHAQRVSLVFSLPLTYAQKIRQVDGVTAVCVGQLVRRRLHHRAQLLPAVRDRAARRYLDMYPEFVLTPDERKAFLADRNGAVAGRKLADKYGWKVGDQIPLRGTIFPGTWTFTLRGIYDGAEAKTDETHVLLPLGLPERDRSSSAIRAAATRSGVFVERAARSRRRPRRFRRRSTRRSRIRSPRR